MGASRWWAERKEHAGQMAPWMYGICAAVDGVAVDADAGGVAWLMRPPEATAASARTRDGLSGPAVLLEVCASPAESGGALVLSLELLEAETALIEAGVAIASSRTQQPPD